MSNNASTKEQNLAKEATKQISNISLIMERAKFDEIEEKDLPKNV